MKFLLAKKLEMTQVFSASGEVIPVTKVIAGPCLVLKKKSVDSDGYTSIKCAFGEKKHLNKAMLGIFKKFGAKNYQYQREFVIDSTDPMYEKINEGDILNADIFVSGDVVTATGCSKGKGFQGVVKRHGFHGHPATHGHKDQLRMPGSAGATGPAHVFKGTRMGGRMGTDQITVTGLAVICIDAENNIIYLKGALPGARNGLIKLVAEGAFEVKAKVAEKLPEENVVEEETVSNKEKGIEITTEQPFEEAKSEELKSDQESKK